MHAVIEALDVCPVEMLRAVAARWRHHHDGWQRLTARLGERIQLVGGDDFCTNPGTITPPWPTASPTPT